MTMGSKTTRYRVRGGNPLEGTVFVQGAKNAALKMIAASLLTSGAAFAQSTTVQGANEGARAGGAGRLAGELVTCAKNAPARGFYAASGFHQVAERDGSSRWELDLANGVVLPAPPWIRVSSR